MSNTYHALKKRAQRLVAIDNMVKNEISVNFNGTLNDRRPLIKNLGNWVEKEGFLFFDSMQVPIPAGFKDGLSLYDYVTDLSNASGIVGGFEDLLDVAIKEASRIVNDPSMAESRSYSFPKLDKVSSGTDKNKVLDIHSKYFNVGDMSRDRDVFTNVFKNANELNLTAMELESLIKLVESRPITKVNEKVNRLATLSEEVEKVLVKEAIRPRADLVANFRDNVIDPLAEWSEAISIYLYQVNVLKVCFSDIEAHVKSLQK